MPIYLKQILTELSGKIDINTITVADFNTPLSNWIDVESRQKITKETL